MQRGSQQYDEQEEETKHGAKKKTNTFANSKYT